MRDATFYSLLPAACWKLTGKTLPAELVDLVWINIWVNVQSILIPDILVIYEKETQLKGELSLGPEFWLLQRWHGPTIFLHATLRSDVLLINSTLCWTQYKWVFMIHVDIKDLPGPNLEMK